MHRVEEEPRQRRSSTAARVTPARKPAPSGSAALLQLGTRIGNRAFTRVARARGTIQRARITVQNVDFNPVSDQFRHGQVDVELFWSAVTNAIRGNQRFKEHTQLNNVVAALRNGDYAAADIDALTTAIAGAIAGKFAELNQGVHGQANVALAEHVRAALVTNIREDPQVAMDKSEAQGFDVLKQIATEQGTMSRAKGTPSRVPHARLPGALQGEIAGFVANVNGENARWGGDALADYMVPDPGPAPALDEIRLQQEVSSRQRGNGRYQGNHSNSAGWLPAVPAPPVHPAFRNVADAVWSAASPELRRRLDHRRARERLGMTDAHSGQPNPYRTEWRQLIDGHRDAITDQILRRTVWGTLAMGVSGYVEFSTSQAISRIVYDVVNDRIYVSAHYKWREGYNPWFEVVGAPAFAF